MVKSQSRSRGGSFWRRATLASTALPLIILAAPAVFAATPASESLPSNFITNNTNTKYSVTAASGQATGTINFGNSSRTRNIVAQFGGGTIPGSNAVNANDGSALPTGVTQNTGFSLGPNSTLNLTNAGSGAVLINDVSGAPSQIFGAINDTSAGPLFIANGNGVVVGATGAITMPAGEAVGLVGLTPTTSNLTAFEGASSPSGSITIGGSNNAGSGAVTLDSAAKIAATGGLIVAGNGAINIGAGPEDGGSIFIASGAAVSVNPYSGIISPPPTLEVSTASVNLTGGTKSAPLVVAGLYAAGNVTNSGYVALNSGAEKVGGTFTNTSTGVVDVAGEPSSSLAAGAVNNAGSINGSTNLTVTGIYGVTNTGAISSTAGITLKSSDGNIVNTGALNLGAGGQDLNLTASTGSIYFGGSVTQGGKALGSTNAVNTLRIAASTNTDGDSTTIDNGGVIDYANTVYANTANVTADAVRFLSGALVSSTNGAVNVKVGMAATSTNAITDPFFGNAKLNYNLSVFPSALIKGNQVQLDGGPYGVSSNSGNMNIDGVVSSQIGSGGYIDVSASTVNASATGGFALNNDGALDLSFAGNVNNPNGAKRAGSSAWQDNYVPVAVANTADGKTGTATIFLAPSSNAPSSNAASPQLVNLLVNGNAILKTCASPSALNGLSTSTTINPESSYVNNHLVVQSTGNIQVGTNSGSTPSTFYWPGLVYLSNVASASNPTQLSTTGSISLGSNAASPVNLVNVLPAVVSGNGGIFLETSNLNLNGGQIWTNTNSWINFSNATVSANVQKNDGNSIFGAVEKTLSGSTITTGLGLQVLPTADYSPQ
ncbi:hypothetical protein ACMV_00530 [Acidiphilium multivorum AIU301]|uniref:Uncharacterized protein n=1 Tax=Acidiphilium multivorum (strain DSM 11245 / JCM 8867 / NBRC 100883 / AIU 301) TaxID=926570 RepID=F0J118_ACIMA|nr:hypothetical protein [Acidiphilium multivorum]BAJ79400.1 hypothetical protein ACMV_00530 [Acidiphilium multivorum AIU301]GAN75133.1 hypothetical protein Apmu_0285_01 [Acidiphilium multivorum AIU301]